MVSTVPPVAPNRGDAPQAQSALYKAIMTPVIFVTFLFSLVVVDLQYSVKRSHLHPDSEQYSSRLPHWLHRLIYRYQPYQYVRIDKDGNPTGQRAYHGFYHSKQRKLMKMEVDDAFQIRRTVLFVMGLVLSLIVWGLWRVILWVARLGSA